jgi:hypothetical protein
MVLDENLGLITWKHASAKSSVYTVEAKAANLVGKDSVTWNISVPLSYTVFIDKLDQLEGSLPVPKPVTIYGTVAFVNEDVARVVPIDVS